MSDPMMAALMALKSKPSGDMPETGPNSMQNEMPMASDRDGSEVYVGTSFFGGKKLKAGDPVCIYGNVSTTGNKIGLSVTSAKLMDGKGGTDEAEPESQPEEMPEDQSE